MGKSKVIGLVRAARVATVGLLAGALIFSGASLANAEDAAPPDAPAAATEGEASSPANSSGADEHAVTEAPPVSDPASPPAPALPSAPEQVSTPEKPAVQLPAEAQTDQPPAARADQAEHEEQDASQPAPEPEAAGIPALRWRTIDADGAVVTDAIVMLEGPRGVANETLGDQEKWPGAPATTVTDNTGAADYAGLDLDPEPGVFRIEAFVDEETAKTDPAALPVAVAEGGDYRVRPDTADGFATGDAAEWTVLDVLKDAGTEPQDVTMASVPSAEPAQDDERGQDDEAVTPLRAGSDLPAAAALASSMPICQAGYAYAISNSGQLQQIVGGVRTNVGTDLGGSDMNGLGISAGGANVYAIKRTGGSDSETATVHSFNTTTGIWSSTGKSQSTSVSLVAGAVNLSTGEYIFGGYAGDGSQFRMWKYSPGSGTFSYLGYVQTSMGSGSNNGDMAFNAAGDLFIVHGRGSSVTVFSVTAANFNAAGGGLIASAKSATISTNSSDVNGVAFDAAGKGYLGSSTQLRSYDMPNWSNGALVTNNLNDSTDLASCSSPATIKLQKIVQGGRSSATDQFRLELKQGSTTLGTATTTGTATGVQPQVVGPLPVVRGATLTFSETFVNGAVASNYATSYRCQVDGAPMSPAVTGTGTSGSITIPSTGESIVCEFVNSPLTASVSITKKVQDTNGQNDAPASGWTVDAVPTATTGTVARTPNSAQQTNGSGTATWPLTFGTAASRATVAVSETQQTGYAFVSGRCVITPSVGDTTEVALTGAAATPLTGVKPGDRVACTYTNKKLPGSISWQKVTDDVPATNIGGSSWSVQGPDAGGPTVAVDDCVGAAPADCAAARDKDERAGYLRTTGLAWGEYTITETAAPEGFELDTTAYRVTITAANAEAGASIDPVVNVRELGQVSWTKTDGTSKLEGSEWSLTGPGGDVAIEDCVGADVAACLGMPDQDPAGGAFLLKDLDWGDYSLVETAAPLGYVLDATPHPFTVNAANAGSVIALGAIVNTLGVAPTLPMTGGLGSDFYSFLGLGVLLLAMVLLAIRRLWLRRQAAVAPLR